MYESSNEDENVDVIEKIAIQNEKREAEAELARLNTIHQMELNRENAKNQIDEEQKKREYLQKLSNSLGITQQREEIDKLNISVTYIAARMQEDRTSINEILQILKNPTGAAIPTEKVDPMQKIEALSQMLGPIVDAYKAFKGTNESVAQPLISQEIINEKMKQNFFDNLETGEDINHFIKDALKKRVTRTVINKALSEIGTGVEHGPITD